MRILVITDVLWRNDNGVGNSYSNIFSGMQGVEIANICCQEGESDNNISDSCFQMSENRLIANLRNKSIPSGVTESRKDSVTVNTNSGNQGRLVRALKRSRLQILFWGRNLIWKVGHWKSEELRSFIDGFKPDLIFAQLQDKIYMNNIVSYVQNYSKCPLVLYAWDDIYSLKQVSFSPLFWIDRFMQRASIRRLVKNCSLLYTISSEQKEEYSSSLRVKTGLLYKGKDFKQKTKEPYSQNKVLQFIYTGNLYSGRYETILSLCKELAKQNKTELKAQLNIYSGTDLTDKQIRELNIENSSFFKGAVSEKEVEALQKSADVLVHIEPLSLKGSLICRLSFSTKLVDYFYNAKCIFAIGSDRCASMKYLKRNDAAIIATSIDEAKQKLSEILSSDTMVKEYSEKSWDCGERNHQIESIQDGLRNNFERIVNGEGCSD